MTVINRTNKRRLDVVIINSLNKKPFRLSGYYGPVQFNAIGLVSEDRDECTSACVCVCFLNGFADLADWSSGCISRKLYGESSMLAM